MTQPEFNPEVFRRAGISVRHILGLMPVSRPTVSLWLSGKQRPSHFIAEEVAEVQHAVEAALADERLPLPDSIIGRHRDSRVKATIREYMGLTAGSNESEGTAA